MKLKDLLACAATGMILCTSCIKNEAPNAEADILMAFKHHANSYLVKQIDFVKFVEQMECAGKYWLTYNRLPLDKDKSE